MNELAGKPCSSTSGRAARVAGLPVEELVALRRRRCGSGWRTGHQFLFRAWENDRSPIGSATIENDAFSSQAGDPAWTTRRHGTRPSSAADRLFYEHGIRPVGMDDIRDASGVSLKRLYRLFPAKERARRGGAAAPRGGVLGDHWAAAVEAAADPREASSAFFDHLHAWFTRARLPRLPVRQCLG